MDLANQGIMLPNSSFRESGCERIEIELEERGASFETAALRLPQDEDFS